VAGVADEPANRRAVTMTATKGVALKLDCFREPLRDIVSPCERNLGSDGFEQASIHSAENFAACWLRRDGKGKAGVKINFAKLCFAVEGGQRSGSVSSCL
jgi:hypothetical protein